MPRINPMPESETRICRRFFEFRRGQSLTRVAAASLLGTDSNRLASYELGRVPLRASIAMRASLVLGVNLRWLAEGVGDCNYYMPVASDFAGQFRENALFSDIYERFLKSYFAEHDKLLAETFGKSPSIEDLNLYRETFGPPSISEDGRVIALRMAVPYVEEIIRKCPPNLLQEFYSTLAKTIRRFTTDNAEAFREFEATSKNRVRRASLKTFRLFDNKKELTKDDRPLLDSDVKSIRPETWQHLKTDLQRLTATHGGKAQLADDLKVSRQVVTKWLRAKDSSQPTADFTLRLLEWAEKEEAKQKRPRSVSTTAKAKAQHERPNEKINTSDPPKR